MKKCCVACLVILLIFVVAIGVAFGVVWNSTPLKLGIADTKILGDSSLTDLGLEQFKIKDITKGIVKMNDFDSSTVLTNAYNSVTEAQNALSALEGSSVKTGAELNCAALLTSEAYYSKNYLKTYSDNTLAFLLDTAISTTEKTDNSYYGGINLSVPEITISNANKPHAKIVLKIPVQASSSVIQNIPNFVLITVSFDFEVSQYGKITSTSDCSAVINDGNEIVSAVIEKMLASALPDGIESVKDHTTSLFAKLITNLGVIGTQGSASVDENGVVSGEPTYGITGVNDGSITFLTYTK